MFFVNYIFDERNINNEIYNNLAYTNGRVTNYQSSTSPTTGGAITSNCHVKYKYTVQDKKYEVYYNDFAFTIPDIEFDRNKDYLVIYDKNKPKNSRIILEIELNDSISNSLNEKLIKRILRENYSRNLTDSKLN